MRAAGRVSVPELLRDVGGGDGAEAASGVGGSTGENGGTRVCPDRGAGDGFVGRGGSGAGSKRPVFVPGGGRGGDADERDGGGDDHLEPCDAGDSGVVGDDGGIGCEWAGEPYADGGIGDGGG